MYLHRLRAGLDASGRLLGGEHRAVTTGAGISIEGIADSGYAVPAVRVEGHGVPTGVPTQWWRSVDHSHAAFAKECFVDELAAAAGRDPVEYRRELLAGSPRLLGVLDLAAARAGWGAPRQPGVGRGVAVHKSFDSYVCEIADVAVGKDGSFKVLRVVAAVDCGLVVNPDIVRAQVEGGIAYGLGAALEGEITLDRGVVVERNFDRYRTLRMPDMPVVEVHIVPSSEKPTGIGEPGLPPIAPAVANAIASITGRRLRRLPLRA
jgi:isoquinoline 1-oxidoreductase beta subunit